MNKIIVGVSLQASDIDNEVYKASLQANEGFKNNSEMATLSRKKFFDIPRALTKAGVSWDMFRYIPVHSIMVFREH